MIKPASIDGASMRLKLEFVNGVVLILDVIISGETQYKNLAQQSSCLTNGRPLERRLKPTVKAQALKHAQAPVWLVLGFHNGYLDLQFKLKP